MKNALLLAALLLATAAAPTPSDIESAAPPTAWAAIAPDDMVVFDTPRGAFIMQLAPQFAPAHVAAIKALVRRGAFGGGAVVRVQDNYVVQWAIPETKVVPAAPLPPEFERPLAGLTFTPIPGPDAYADAGGFIDGFPVAVDKSAKTVWLQHCYGMVGVGRGNAPDSGDGGELYAVIGHAPRHLDRNIAVIGRVIEGIEHLSSLPRGSGRGFCSRGRRSRRRGRGRGRGRRVQHGLFGRRPPRPPQPGPPHARLAPRARRRRRPRKAARRGHQHDGLDRDPLRPRRPARGRWWSSAKTRARPRCARPCAPASAPT